MHSCYRRASLLVALFLLARPGLTAEKDSTKVRRNLSAAVDRAIDAKLKAEKVVASSRSDDAEFLRRVSLDITGVIPTADRAAAFLDSTDPDKRARLIDELLANPQWGKHMADMWSTMLLPKNSDNRRLQVEPMAKWLEESFNANKPWDQFVTELVTASGTQDKNGAVTYFLANSTVDKITDSVTRQFLGVQLQCAQCHNHPFTGWKQTEYWAMAAFFMKVRPDNVARAARNGETPGLVEAPAAARGRQRLPESAKLVPAKFLQGEAPKLNPTEPYRPVLAKWLTSSSNPYFAKAMVNRMWHQFMGRGLVNPVDDMHDGNAASHPELLKDLADGFAASGFDVKALVRAICNSQAYQRSSKPQPGNDDAPENLYARQSIRVLSPEQLYDSLIQATGGSSARPDRPARPGAGRRPQAGGRAAFVASFMVEDGADPTEYQAGIPQALRLMNSTQFNYSSVAAAATRSSGKPEQVIEKMYLAVLSRRPSADELSKLTAYTAKQGANTAAYSDIAWALFNTAEFCLNR
jgi:Protein of unknown function (DUF1549)/Protein of unknown function (DUF1553)